MSPSTVSRVLRRAGLSRLSDLDPSEPIVRYEHEQPGDLIHIDTKKLGRRAHGTPQSLPLIDIIEPALHVGDNRMGMNINLTPQLEELVRSKVASGLYTSASEVVREALRLLEEQDRLRDAKLAQLRADVRQGMNSGPSEPWDAAAVKRKARARRTTRPTAA